MDRALELKERLSDARGEKVMFVSPCVGKTFGYDIWANLLSIGGASGYTGCTQEYLSVRPTNGNPSYQSEPIRRAGDFIRVAMMSNGRRLVGCKTGYS